MKRMFLLTIAVVVALCGGATDRFYIEDFAVAPGETCIVSILLDNETAYTAFQSDLYLPEGLTAESFALTSRKNSNHTLTATVLPDGGIRLLSYSLKLKTYSGNSGALVTFNVTASDEFDAPATIELRNTMFTTAAGIEVAFGNEFCNVTIPVMEMIGDVNGDGFINITDVTVLINYLLTDDASGVNIINADTNKDGNINISDVTTLINFLLTDSWP